MAIPIIYPLDVDLKIQTHIQEPHVTKNDSVVFLMRITDDGQPVGLDDITTYTLAFVNPNRVAEVVLGEKNEDGTIQFEMTSTATAVTGKFMAAVQLYAGSERVSSMPFSYVVQKDMGGARDVKPEERPLISLVLGDGPFILEAAQAATQEANAAAAFADNVRINTETERLATESVRLATEESKDAADLAAAAANTSAENADAMATAAEEAAALAAQEANDAREQKEEIAEIITTGPVTSVNGKTGAVQGMAEQSAVLAVGQQLTEKENSLNGRIDNLVGELPAEGELMDLRYSPVTGITHLTAQARVSDAEEHLTELQERTERPAYYDEVKGEYVNLDKFWDLLRTGKKYTVEFNQYSVSPSPLGTKKDDNAGLICEPSTNTFKGRNDYENIGLFMAIDVNGYVDENDDYHVTAMKGDGKFKADGTNGDVWVMAMPGYIKRRADANTWSFSYSDVMHPGYEILDEAVKPDGSVRPYLLHAKYIAGRGLDGQLASISGVYPEYANMSHDDQITKFKEKGGQYSGKTSHDDFYTSMMFYLKYATTHSQSIMQGAQYYYVQYTPAIAEQNTSRFIVTNAQADNILLGSTVSIGDFGSGSINADRNAAQNYSIANRVEVLSKERLADGANTAIYVNAPLFSTTVTSTITTYPWNAGGCDNVLGTDGSPWDNQSGKEPFIINGIEIMVGGYEVLQNLIIYNDNTDPENYKIEVYANYDCRTYATSPTEAYDLVGHQLVQTGSSWSYIAKTAIDDQHPSLLVPVEAGGSSTTGFADGVYTNAPTTGYRQWLSFGVLSFGARVGLRFLFADFGLSDAGWYFLGRLSATGRSRRRAGVN